VLAAVRGVLIEVLEARNSELPGQVAELGNGWRGWSGCCRGTGELLDAAVG
jgi:hypothetical protein